MATKKVGIAGLNGKNYQTWKYQIECVISHRELSDVIKSKQQDTDSKDDTKKKAFDKIDAEARALLVETIEQEVIQKIICKTAHDIWTRLKGLYESKGECNLDLLINEFGKLDMKPTEDVTSFIGRLEELAVEIRAQGETISERWLKSLIVGGLSSAFDGFSRVWSSTPIQERTLEHLIDRLVQDETERKNRRNENHETAFYSRKTSYANRDRQHERQHDRQHDRHLDRQHDRQHDRHHDRQQDRQRDRQHDRYHDKNQQRPPTPDYVKDMKKTSTCRNCGLLDHWWYECRNGQRRNNNPEIKKTNRTQHHQSDPFPSNKIAFMALEVGTCKGEWYADSGASSHMTRDKHIFKNYIEFAAHERINIY